MPISDWAVKEAIAAYLRPHHGNFELRMRAALEAAEAVREQEVSEAMIRAGARILTGEIAATCCHTTGGHGNGNKHCCCRSAAVDVYRAMLASSGGNRAGD